MKQQRTRIKFCGITRIEDALAAVALGVDALGFILVPGSPRRVTLKAAAAMRRKLPPLVSVVTLLRNPDSDEVWETIDAVQPHLLQFHGEEAPAFCASFGLPYLKAVAMRGLQRPLAEIALDYADAAALLLDGHAPGELGGQGKAFDWSRIDAGRRTRSGQCRRRDPPGASVCSGCQQWHRIQAGNQGFGQNGGLRAPGP